MERLERFTVNFELFVYRENLNCRNLFIWQGGLPTVINIITLSVSNNSFHFVFPKTAQVLAMQCFPNGDII